MKSVSHALKVEVAVDVELRAKVVPVTEQAVGKLKEGRAAARSKR